jgi:hypothetical protein
MLLQAGSTTLSNDFSDMLIQIIFFGIWMMILRDSA